MPALLLLIIGQGVRDTPGTYITTNRSEAVITDRHKWDVYNGKLIIII